MEVLLFLFIVLNEFGPGAECGFKPAGGMCECDFMSMQAEPVARFAAIQQIADDRVSKSQAVCRVNTKLVCASGHRSECHKKAIFVDFLHAVFCNCFLSLFEINFLTRSFVIIGAEWNRDGSVLAGG